LDRICSTIAELQQVFLGVDFVGLVLFSVAAFHAVASFYLEIFAYFVKSQISSELYADIEVLTPASVDAR